MDGYLDELTDVLRGASQIKKTAKFGKGGGVGPGGKISLNCLELCFLGFTYTLTRKIVKCDTPESISIPLKPKQI